MKSGFYEDWLGDLVIIYPDGSYEYWAAIDDPGFMYFQKSTDLALLNCLEPTFICEF